MDNAIIEDPSMNTDNKQLPSHPTTTDFADQRTNLVKDLAGCHGDGYLNSGTNDMSFAMVQAILKRTSQTVQDLDNYLSANKETRSVKQ